MNLALVNTVVLVTGGASGIGRECTRAYVREGARVAIADLDEPLAVLVAKECGNGTIALKCDVGDGPSVETAIRRTVQVFGGLDCVHNNAGISSPSKPIHETSEREWDDLQRVNLKSVYWTTRYALPHLIASRGAILNTASMVGLIGQRNHAAYVATKGAMISLTKAMALDYAPMKIRVNAICPAGVWTPLLRQWAAEQPNPAEVSTFLDNIHALGYCPEGDVIADAAVFLLSRQARFITGCALPVSGGAELGYKR